MMAPPRLRKPARALIAVLVTVIISSLLRRCLLSTEPLNNVALKEPLNEVALKEPLNNVALKPTTTCIKDPMLWNPEEILRKGHDRLPFPVENTWYLPTAYSTAAACKNESKYLFFIHTAAGNFNRRTIMRSCLGNRNFSTYYQWTTVFFVGLSADKAIMRRVYREASQHGDVVVLPCTDAYRNMTYKFVYGMKWTIENCPSVKYVVKMDDDFVVNVLKVVTYIDKLPKDDRFEFRCYVHKNSHVQRNASSKWYVSEEVYRRKIYPQYCAGGSTVINAEALRGLYNASFSLPFHGIDDVYVTGEASLVAGVRLVPINKLYNLYSSGKEARSQVTSGKVIFSNVQSDKDRALAWKAISASLAKTISATKSANKTKS